MLRPFVYGAVPPPTPYTTDLPTFIKLAEATSYQFNSRNIERPYYPLHHRIISDVAHYDNLTTHTNGSVDVQWDETGVLSFHKVPHMARSPNFACDTPRAKSDQYDPLHDPKAMYFEKDSDDEASDDEDEIWETSSSRSSKTTPSRQDFIKEGSPDIVVTHTRLSAMDVPTLIPEAPAAARTAYDHAAFKFRLHGGVKIHHYCPALIGEIKPGPYREFYAHHDIDWRIVEATSDLFLYANMVFAVHPYLEEIACYAAAGMYWTWRVVERQEIENAGAQYNWGGLSWVDKAKARDEALLFHGRFPHPQEIGTAQSDAEYSRMRQDYFHYLGNDWQPKSALR